MSRIDLREFTGGLLLTLLGAVFAAYAASHYSIGTVTRMGPGMVPVILGVLLAFFGVIVAIGAFLRTGSWPELRLVVPAIVSASILAFALMIGSFGMIPAVFACVAIASLAEARIRPVTSLILAGVLSVVAWLVFVVALQLPIRMIGWPL